MNLGAQVATGVLVLSAVLAVASLWRGARQDTGLARHTCWLFAFAIAAWAAGAVGMQILANAAAGGGFPLTLADLPGLLALPALAAGVAGLAPPRGNADWHPLGRRSSGRVGAAVAHLTDGYVLAASVFVVSWITVLHADYTHSGDDPRTFAVELVHPLADLVVLGVVLVLAAAAGRRGVAPFLALLAVSVSDVLSVGARVGNGHPGVAAQLLLVAGFAVLASAPWLGAARASRQAGPSARPGPYAATIVAALAAVAAALVVIGHAVISGTAPDPVAALTGGTAVLALCARILVLVHRDTARSRLWQESGQQFRELAERTSDVVLVCDYSGTIGYASPAARAYGYLPSSLDGKMLPDLVHPEDRPEGIRAVREAAAESVRQIRYACRVRAADGTWRHVEATISRYRSQAAPDLLLITARDVSDQVELRRQIAHLTFHDGLTGLPNRAYLEDRAREALSPGRPDGAAPLGVATAGVILVDLDEFTGVNDMAGHAAGDLVLAQVARRLMAVVPARATVARWGGDEFAVLVPEAANAQEIADAAERIVASITAEPFRAADQEVSLSVSVGVALADGSPAGYVWRNADAAVSRAKESGGGRVEMFSPQPDADTRHRLELAAQLSQALHENRLELDYQPLADLPALRVSGAQAVAQWRENTGSAAGPAQGGAAPGTTRPDLAGIAGLPAAAAELGAWMLGEACAQATAWRRAGWAGCLWLYCPPRQVRAPGFADSVLAALSSSGLDGAALILEVAGEVLADGCEASLGGLGVLRERGVRLAVDVCAAELGSLAQLGELPVDVIKIGPALVAGLGADASAETLIRAMVTVGKDLGLTVMADGIEHAGQAELLAAMGATLGKGPLVTGPVPPASLAQPAGQHGQRRDEEDGGERPFGNVISPAETNALSS